MPRVSSHNKEGEQVQRDIGRESIEKQNQEIILVMVCSFNWWQKEQQKQKCIEKFKAYLNI